MQTMPTPSPALGTLIPSGARIYYSDNSIVTIAPPGNIMNKWRNAPVDNVVLVQIVFDETYVCYINGLPTTRHYTHIFQGASGDGDYYWYNGGNIWGCGLVTDVPNGLPNGAIKTGVLVSDSLFSSIYELAKENYAGI